MWIFIGNFRVVRVIKIMDEYVLFVFWFWFYIDKNICYKLVIYLFKNDMCCENIYKLIII